MNINPFGIGPVGAFAITGVICATVVGCVGIISWATVASVKAICQTIDEMWDDIKVMIRGQ